MTEDFQINTPSILLGVGIGVFLSYTNIFPFVVGFGLGTYYGNYEYIMTFVNYIR